MGWGVPWLLRLDSSVKISIPILLDLRVVGWGKRSLSSLEPNSLRIFQSSLNLFRSSWVPGDNHKRTPEETDVDADSFRIFIWWKEYRKLELLLLPWPDLCKEEKFFLVITLDVRIQMVTMVLQNERLPIVRFINLTDGDS